MELGQLRFAVYFRNFSLEASKEPCSHYVKAEFFDSLTERLILKNEPLGQRVKKLFKRLHIW